MVEIDIEYEGDLHCRAQHGPSGSSITTDAPLDNQGRGAAFAPTDLLAVSFGTCIITTMGIYARRKEIDLRGSRVHVTKEMVADPLRRVGRLVLTVDLPSRIAPAQRRALENAAHTCPIHRSLHPDVRVEMAFRYSL
jgi:putative redox protein